MVQFDKPTATSLKDYAANTLRQAILRGELRPGTRIVEQAVAEEMGISRGPVREAMLELESEGLIVIYPRRGAEVRTLSPQDAWEIQTLRGTLEAFAVQLHFATLDSTDIEYLQQLVCEMATVSEPPDLGRLVDLDVKFHGFIVDRADHHRLSETFHSLDPMNGAIFYLALCELGFGMENMAQAHQVIVDTLRTGKLNQVVEEIQAHYLVPAEQLRQLIDGQGVRPSADK